MSTSLPTLYHQGKPGGIYSWRVWTEGRVEIMRGSGKSWRDTGTVEQIAAALEDVLPAEPFFVGQL